MVDLAIEFLSARKHPIRPRSWIFFVVDGVDFAIALPNRNLGVDEVDLLTVPRAAELCGCLQPGPRGESLVALDRTGGGGCIAISCLPHDDFLGLDIGRDFDLPHPPKQ